MRAALRLLAALVLGMPAVGAAETIGHGGPIRAMAVAPNGAVIATAGFDYSVVLWESGERLPLARHVEHDASVTAITIRASRQRVWSGDQAGRLVVWDIGDERSVAEHAAHEGPVAALATNGRHVASAGWDGVIRFWNGTTFEPVAELALERPLTDIAFLDAGTLLAADREGALHRVALDGDVALLSAGSGLPVMAIALTPERDVLAVDSAGMLSLYRLPGGERASRIEAHGVAATALAVGRTGRIATGDAQGRMILWRLDGRTPVRVVEVEAGPVWALAFTDDGRAVVTAGGDGRLRAWDARTGDALGDDALPGDALGDDAGLATAGAREPAGIDDPRGAKLFKKCAACHTVTADGGNRAGPSLHGLFGREAGTVEGYPYSQALEESELVWSEETIDRLFASGPHIVTPGSKMPLQRMPNARDRRHLIAYLKTITTPSQVEEQER